MSTQTHSPSAFRRNFPTVARIFSRRVLKALGFAFAALVTLIALFYAIENWRGAREWNAVREELIAAGEPLTFGELLPPMPPDEENFAMTPFFRGFFDKSIDPETGKPVWQIRQVESKLPEWPKDLKAGSTWRLGDRHEFSWDPGAIERAQLSGKALPTPTNTALEVIQQALKTSRAVMDEIETSVRRPQSQFPIHFEDNVSALLPHLASLKGLGYRFSQRALIHLDQGNTNAALLDIETTLRIGNSLRNEPILISGLVRVAIIGFAMQPLWEGLVDGRWTDDQLREVQTHLQGIDMLAAYGAGMRGERIFGTELADIVERDRNYGMYGLYGTTEGSSEAALLFNLAPKGWFQLNKAFVARIHTAHTLKAINPIARRYRDDEVQAYSDQVQGEVVSNRKLFLARLVLPALGGASIKFATAQTDVDQAIVACALERFRFKNDRYPSSLGELVPDHLTAVPRDIMDGQPLRYRAEAGSFVLYSIGANGKDDGGVAGFKETRKGKVWQREEGDWVWTGGQ